MISLLDSKLYAFPNPMKSDPSGILAIEGDLDPKRLLLAYSLGIFPWYTEGETPILWHFPHERMVLPLSEFHLSRRFKQFFKKHPFQIKYNTAFSDVLHHCASVPREGQKGTWLNSSMITSYTELHSQGYAHSVEAWFEDQLVGGVYGVTLGGIFFAESMFTLMSESSKVALATLVHQLKAYGYILMDCQAYTENTERFGAFELTHTLFQPLLHNALKIKPTHVWPSNMI
jgi:leucyl/phenylalanyl-tRNA--protein transferase